MGKPLWTYLACRIAVSMISMDNLIVTNAQPVIRRAMSAIWPMIRELAWAHPAARAHGPSGRANLT
jgi:hypothetical protein